MHGPTVIDVTACYLGTLGWLAAEFCRSLPRVPQKSFRSSRSLLAAWRQAHLEKFLLANRVKSISLDAPTTRANKGNPFKRAFPLRSAVLSFVSLKISAREGTETAELRVSERTCPSVFHPALISACLPRYIFTLGTFSP